MIEYQVLRQLVLEALKVKPDTQISTLFKEVERLADRHDVFPTEDECREHNINYTPYKERRLHLPDQLNVSQLVWVLLLIAS